MKKNNAGFSLVELIIAIAMLAVLTGLGAFGLGQLTGFRARETADKIATSLTENKVETLGKAKSPGGMAWEIYREDDDYYVRTVYDAGGAETYSNPEKVNDGRVKIYFVEEMVGGAQAITTLGNGTGERFYFNRSTGALCDSTGADVSSNYTIRVEQGSKQYEVKIISKTGKVISDSRK